MEKKYEVTEVFLSVQGEGPQAGRLAVFVRFSGCNLNCSFCDENHRTGKAVAAAQIREMIDKAVETHFPEETDRPRPLVVLTGGEPLLQIDDELLDAIDDYEMAIESNGDESCFSTVEEEMNAAAVLQRIGTVVISPKTGNLSMAVVRAATHVKMLVPFQDKMGVEFIKALMGEICRDRYRRGALGRERVFLQPITEYSKADIGKPDCKQVNMNSLLAMNHAIQLAKAGIDVRVVPQTHVFMGLL